jgi:hypothetical protein
MNAGFLLHEYGRRAVAAWPAGRKVTAPARCPGCVTIHSPPRAAPGRAPAGSHDRGRDAVAPAAAALPQ